MRITVFGGSQPVAGDACYEQARELGRLIGERGWTAITGGYIGTMEAVSRGANEAGGHVIGVSCEQIEAWRSVHPNAWVIEDVRIPTLTERIDALIDLCDGAIALPGGVGTLAEIALMWNRMLIRAIPPRPLVLLGSGWRAVIHTFYGEMGRYMPPLEQTPLIFCDTPAQAIETLIQKCGKV